MSSSEHKIGDFESTYNLVCLQKEKNKDTFKYNKMALAGFSGTSLKHS